MKVVIQRVNSAKVTISNQIVGSIQSGLLTFWGFHKNDTIEQAKYCLNKYLSCRLFEDSSNKMNLSLTDTKKELKELASAEQSEAMWEHRMLHGSDD